MKYHRCWVCLDCLDDRNLDPTGVTIGLIGLGRCTLCGHDLPRDRLDFYPIEKLVEAGVPASAFEGIDLE